MADLRRRRWSASTAARRSTGSFGRTATASTWSSSATRSSPNAASASATTEPLPVSSTPCLWISTGGLEFCGGKHRSRLGRPRGRSVKNNQQQVYFGCYCTSCTYWYFTPSSSSFSFSVIVSTVWYWLPASLRDLALSSSSFRQPLKTDFFNCHSAHSA